MGKHKKWVLEDKIKIVKEFKKGATISYLNNKYGIIYAYSNLRKGGILNE